MWNLTEHQRIPNKVIKKYEKEDIDTFSQIIDILALVNEISADASIFN